MRGDLAESDVPDNHNVDIARRCLRALSDRTVDEGYSDPIDHRLQRLQNHIAQPCRLGQNVLEFGKNRVGRIRLIINLVSSSNPRDQSNICQALQFPLGGPKCSLRPSYQISQIELFLGMTIEESENSAARIAKEKLSDRRGRTHFGYDCILSAYIHLASPSDRFALIFLSLGRTQQFSNGVAITSFQNGLKKKKAKYFIGKFIVSSIHIEGDHIAAVTLRH